MFITKYHIKQFFLILIILFFYTIPTFAFDSLEEFEASEDSFFSCADLKKQLSSNELESLNYALQHGANYKFNIHDIIEKKYTSFDLMNLAKMGYNYLARYNPFNNTSYLSNICRNTYIVQPHEYINREKGWIACDTNSNEKYKNIHTSALNASDVPFYYSCTPKFLSKNITYYNKDNYSHFEENWGFMGYASPYCLGKAKNYSMDNNIGKVRVEYANEIEKNYDKCSKNKRPGVFLKAGETQIIGDATFTAFYDYSYWSGKYQLCVAVISTDPPIKVGCSYVAPQIDKLNISRTALDFVQETRCHYFLSGRTDLWGLGKILPDYDSNSHSGEAIKLFLQSDFHTTSTVVGCIKDLILKVFLNSHDTPHLKKGLMLTVQEKLREIVYAVLVLYVSLVGIKIMNSPQVPNRGEFMMFLMKFSLVLYFTTSGAWYYENKGKVEGLFPALLTASEELATLFLKAQNINDPIGLCRYRYNGNELLTPRTIAVSEKEDISNSYKVTLSFWDLVDCKIINYLNLGSCNYSSSGIISIWIGAASLLVNGNGFLLVFISFIYVFILLLVVYKFAHIFILSMLMLSLLILISPIIICFALFEATKSIFQSWFRMIIGYILLPSLLFAFVSIMLIVFDSIYFGDLTLKTNEINKTKASIIEACKGVNSIFCTTVGTVAQDPCSANIGALNQKFLESVNFKYMGDFSRLKIGVADAYFDLMLHLMLFTVLFYFFINAVIELISVLTGIYTISNQARGSIDITKPFNMIGSALANRTTQLSGTTLASIVGKEDKIPRQ